MANISRWCRPYIYRVVTHVRVGNVKTTFINDKLEINLIKQLAWKWPCYHIGRCSIATDRYATPPTLLTINTTSASSVSQIKKRNGTLFSSLLQNDAKDIVRNTGQISKYLLMQTNCDKLSLLVFRTCGYPWGDCIKVCCQLCGICICKSHFEVSLTVVKDVVSIVCPY